MKSPIKMAIIRPIGIPISRNFYNSQEIGLARGLSRCGISVDVYVAGKDPELVCQNIETPGSGSVRLFEVPFFKLPLIDHAIYPKLIGLLKEGRYNFIQVNEENELTSFWIARYARKHGIPVVVYQGMYQQLTGRIYVAFQQLYDIVLLPQFRNYIDVALVKTSRAKAHLERKGFKNLRIVPVGLDATPFSHPKDRNWRIEFEIPAAASILLYVGIFERRRNVDFMVDLAKKLVNDGVFLVMAGVGPEHERIASRISAERISNVRLVGTVSQEVLPSLYRESSLFLLPSNYEIYGMVVIEAMYFGLPVISTRTAGPEDIIESNVDGILMNSLDVDDWANAIINLLIQHNKYNEMRFNAKYKVINKLQWETIANEYNDNIISMYLHH